MERDDTSDEIQNPHQEKKKGFFARLLYKYHLKPLADIVNAIHKEEAAQKEEENQAHVIYQRQVDKQEDANRIAKGANWINLFIFLATLSVFIWNIKGINAAIKAATAADSTVKISQQQFTIDNTPFLQVDKIRIHFHGDTADTITYRIESLSNTPVVIYSSINYLMPFIKNRKNSFVDVADSSIFNAVTFKNPQYISKEFPIDQHTLFNSEFFNSKKIDSIKNGNVALVLAGRYVYTNPATRRPRSYIFEVQLFPSFTKKVMDSIAGYYFVYNDNIDLPYDTMTFLAPTHELKKELYPDRYGWFNDIGNEFMGVNEPYLETIINSFDSVTPHKIEIGYSIRNISDVPVQIIGRRYAYDVDTSITAEQMDVDETFKSIKKASTFKINGMIFKDAPLFDKFEFYPRPPDSTLFRSGDDVLLRMGYSLFIADEIELENVVSGKKILYRTLIKVNPSHGERNTPYSKILYHRIFEEK